MHFTSKNSEILSRPGGGERKHLPFLDGLRGLAALYVVCHHFLLWSADGASPWMLRVVSWTAFGHFAVNVFIVVSGFSLMLPVVSSAEHHLRGGVLNYLKRRAKRILPPYYAALGLSMLVIVAVLPHSAHAFTWGDTPELSPGSIVSHLLLIFNWFSQWNNSINMALWSVATEWQIYFFFPLLLLPVWRRAGAACILAGAFVGLLPHFLLPAGQNLDWACPWFIALFAMGMTVTSLQGRKGKPFLWLGGIICCAIFYLPLMTWFKGDEFAWTRDLCAGALTTCLLAWCLGMMEQERKPWVLRLLESRVCVILGAFSYSLYLTHCAVLNVFFYLTQRFHLTPNTALLLRAFIGIPCCLLLAYAFYWCFERPFLGKNATLAGRLAAVKAEHSATP